MFATTDLETEKEMFKALANLLLTVPGVQADGLLQKYKENPDAFVDKAFAKSILTNKKAFEKILPGGMLCTFGCSQAVNEEQCRTAVFTAAASAGRKVRILHQLHQPADHPINIYHSEGEYLKGLVLYVE